MEKKVKHKHKDGKEHAHVGGDKKHEHSSKPDRKDVFVKSKVHTWSTDFKDQKEDADKVRKTLKLTYKADYTLIDRTIDDIKKVSRTVCVNDYATNNVYLMLQDALKKVVLAEK